MRMSLYIDDKLFIGASFTKAPTNDEETIALLEHLIEVIKAPKIPYTDCLDKMES